MLNNCFDFAQLGRVPRAWVRVYAPAGKDAVNSRALRPVVGLSNRATTDAVAAWHRWGLANVPDWPSGSVFWLEVLCRARAETLSSLDLSGMKSNLAGLGELAPDDAVARPLYLVSRQIFLGGLSEHTDIFSGSSLLSASARPRGKSLLARLFRVESGLMPPEDTKITETLRQAALHLYDEATFISSVQDIVFRLGEWYAPVMDNLGAGMAARLLQRTETESAESPATSDSEYLPPQSEIDTSSNHQLVFDNYKVYSNSLDETDAASKWLRQSDIDELGRLNQPERREVRRIAHQLQRRLQAVRLRHWSFDKEEGFLDSRRLARLIGSRPDPRVFRVERDGLLQDACVCFLVDQSGSMRGSRQQMAALAIDLAVHTLETCSISSEVLGYTTRFRDDSPLVRHWTEAGKQARPGRLNAVRHVVFKQTHQPWRKVRKNLGLLLRKNFGNENLDGEAVLWAGRRLLSCKESQKILIVLSDGTPFDRATTAVMGREYLENHLRKAISATDAQGIRVMAIGTGQSVGAFYQSAVTVKGPKEIPAALMQSLSTALLGEGQPLRQ